MDIVHSIKSLSLPISVPDGIEVWRIGFNFPAPISTEDLLLLSELERAQTLLFQRHADQLRSFVTGVTLRRILDKKMMRSPSELRFLFSPHGKPNLQGETNMEFNVSHAGQFALIALSEHGQIGVDIEDLIPCRVAKEVVMKVLWVVTAEHLKEVSVIPNHTDEYNMECENQEWLGTKAWSLVAPNDYAATLAAPHSRAPPDEME